MVRRDVQNGGRKKDFVWDDNRQLVAVRKGDSLVRYGYDGLGRRVFKQTATETRWFYWQDDALAGETVTATGAPLAALSLFDTGGRLARQKAQAALFGGMREYICYPGGFRPLALLTQDAGEKQNWHYHCDPNGAPVRLTSPAGEIVWSEKTGVWGEKGAVHASRIDNPLRFQGQYFDAETGLRYNRYRYYDPAIAGYISQDPIGLAGGLNIYAYGPNPLGWVDPLGLSCSLDTKSNRWRNNETGRFTTRPTDPSDLVKNGRINKADIDAWANQGGTPNTWGTILPNSLVVGLNMMQVVISYTIMALIRRRQLNFQIPMPQIVLQQA